MKCDTQMILSIHIRAKQKINKAGFKWSNLFPIGINATITFENRLNTKVFINSNLDKK